MKALKIAGSAISFLAIILLVGTYFLPIKIDTVKVGIIFTSGVLIATIPYLWSLISRLFDSSYLTSKMVKNQSLEDTNLELSNQKLRDYECLNYLTKRLNQLDSVKGKELCREINDILFSKEFLNEKITDSVSPVSSNL